MSRHARFVLSSTSKYSYRRGMFYFSVRLKMPNVCVVEVVQLIK